MNLLEILIALTIAAVMTTTTTVAVLPLLEASKVKQTEIDLQGLKLATMTFIFVNGRNPTSFAETCASPVTSNCSVNDVWGNPYQFNGVVISSNGPDGVAGNDDDQLVNM